MLVVLNNPDQFSLRDCLEFRNAKRDKKLDEHKKIIAGTKELPRSVYMYLPFAISFDITVHMKG